MYRKLRLWCDGVVSSVDVHMMALYFLDWMILHVNVLFLYRKSWTELILFVLARESSWEGSTWSPYPSVFDFDVRKKNQIQIWNFFQKSSYMNFIFSLFWTRFLQATQAVEIKFKIFRLNIKFHQWVQEISFVKPRNFLIHKFEKLHFVILGQCNVETASLWDI